MSVLKRILIFKKISACLIILSLIISQPLYASDPMPMDPGPNNPGMPGKPPGDDDTSGGDNPSGQPDNEKDPDSPLSPADPRGSDKTKEYDTANPKTRFLAYDEGYHGGVRVTTGANGKGFDRVITASGKGSSHVKVYEIGYEGKEEETASFYAFTDTAGNPFEGGIHVAAGDINQDGVDDIFVGAGTGGNAHVKVFDGVTNQELRSFFAYTDVNGTPSQVEVRVASADINGDGVADIITATGPGTQGHVKVFDGRTNEEIKSFFAGPSGFTGGLFVAAGDVNGDGQAEIIIAPDAEIGTVGMITIYDSVTEQVIFTFKGFGANHNGEFYGGVRVYAQRDRETGLATIFIASGPDPDAHIKAFVPKIVNGQITFDMTVSFLPYGDFRGGGYVAHGYFNVDSNSNNLAPGRYGIVTGAGGGSYDSPYGPTNIADSDVRVFYEETPSGYIPIPQPQPIPPIGTVGPQSPAPPGDPGPLTPGNSQASLPGNPSGGPSGSFRHGPAKAPRNPQVGGKIGAGFFGVGNKNNLGVGKKVNGFAPEVVPAKGNPPIPKRPAPPDNRRNNNNNKENEAKKNDPEGKLPEGDNKKEASLNLPEEERLENDKTRNEFEKIANLKEAERKLALTEKADEIKDILEKENARQLAAIRRALRFEALTDRAKLAAQKRKNKLVLNSRQLKKVNPSLENILSSLKDAG